MFTPPEFPQPIKTINLTDYVEIIKVDQLYEHTSNQFEIVNYDVTKTIQNMAAKYNIFQGSYIPYAITSIESDRLKIIEKSWYSIIERKQTIFFVNILFTKSRLQLETLLFDLWRTNAGTVKMGSTSFPEPFIRFPYIMPSRGKTFR